MVNSEQGQASWRQYLSATVVVGAASTICVILRLLSVARFNAQTTYQILQNQSTTNIIIGTLIALLPTICIIIVVASTFALVFPNRLHLYAKALLLTAATPLLPTRPCRYSPALCS